MRWVARWLVFVLVGWLASPAHCDEAQAPAPPGQPASGPGGLAYAFEGVRITRYGEGADGYWVFEPVGAADGPRPVVVFVHGLNAISYRGHWLWIRHLVRRGNLVIYPQYQTAGLIDPRTFTGKAAAAAREALGRFDGDRHLRADPERFALVGHSLGGTIAANLAADHERYGLPKPRALMAVQPGDVRADSGLAALLPTLVQDHSTIPAGTLMLVIATEDDAIVGRGVARRVFNAAEQVDHDDKDFILIHGDDHGRPALIADHFVPSASVDARGIELADALDFALWRWFDALSAAAFGDEAMRPIALGNTPEQRDLGAWSDGTPVRPPTVTDDP